MTSDTRAKMVAGAADLMSRRGVNATSLRDVVRHTGTPRGSLGHHFPRGKQQLIEDALVFAGKQVSGPLAHLTRSMARSEAYALSLAFGGRRWSERNSRRAVRCLRWRSSSMSTMRPRKTASRTRRRSSTCSIWRKVYSPSGSASCSRRCGARAWRRARPAACGARHRIDGRHGRDVPRRAQHAAARRYQAGTGVGTFQCAVKLNRRSAIESS